MMEQTSTRGSRVFTEDNLVALKDALVPQGALNELGVAAALDRRSRSRGRWGFSPLTAGGLRQSVITLVQTSLGGGVLTLAYAIRLSGLGLGLALMALMAFIAYSGMDILMRGALQLQATSTASLLSSCLGPRSGALMDFLLAAYGLGALMAYFVLLGDFVPEILRDMAVSGLMPPPAEEGLRTHCILIALCVAIPMAIPRNLSGLRYFSPVALLAILFTAVVVVLQSPTLFVEHVGKDPYGEVEWFVLGPGFSKSFSILLFAFNCHLNIVPVTVELTDTRDTRICKICRNVVIVETLLYSLMAVGGYLSFLEATEGNILKDYGFSYVVLACRILLAVTLIVGIPTNLLPTVRSAMALTMTLLPRRCYSAVTGGTQNRAPLLQHGDEESPTSAGLNQPTWASEVLRFCVTGPCLALVVFVAIKVPSIADIMGLVGASIGTFLMMGLPLAVLFTSPPAHYSKFRIGFTVAVYLFGSLVAFAAIGLIICGAN